MLQEFAVEPGFVLTEIERRKYLPIVAKYSLSCHDIVTVSHAIALSKRGEIRRLLGMKAVTVKRGSSGSTVNGGDCAPGYRGVVHQEHLVAALTEEFPLRRRREVVQLLAAYRREVIAADREGGFPRSWDGRVAATIFDAFQALQPPRSGRTLRLFRHDAAVKEELRQTLYLLRWCFWRRGQAGAATYCSPQEFGKISAFSTEVSTWE